MVSQAKSKSQVSEFPRILSCQYNIVVSRRNIELSISVLGAVVNNADTSFDFTSLTVKQ
jgi:hypothetical protein